MADNMETLQEFAAYEAQIKTLAENLELIEGSIVELKKVKEGLKVIKEAKVGSEILVPMGPDSFINAKITDTKNVIIGLGSGVVAKKSIGAAIIDMEERIKELEDVRKKSDDRLQLYTEKYKELAPHVQEIVASNKEKG